MYWFCLVSFLISVNLRIIFRRKKTIKSLFPFHETELCIIENVNNRSPYECFQGISTFSEHSQDSFRCKWQRHNSNLALAQVTVTIKRRLQLQLYPWHKQYLWDWALPFPSLSSSGLVPFCSSPVTIHILWQKQGRLANIDSYRNIQRAPPLGISSGYGFAPQGLQNSIFLL